MEYSFKNSKHNDQKRANKNNRLSDSIVDYEDVALEYFKDLDGNLRCALSGEILQEDNFSKEHIIALAIGGHDIAANIVPTAMGYNLIKRDMYILKYLELQENQGGEKIYSSYRLLKIVNYMLKSINARGTEIDKYREAILMPNGIDEYLRHIEINNKETIYPNRIAPKSGEAGTIERNNEEVEFEGEGITIYTFISDAINKLKDEAIIPKECIRHLENIFENTKEIDVFRKLGNETEMRQEIIRYLRNRNIGNEYDIAYILQQSVRTQEEVEKKIDAVLECIAILLKQNGIDEEWGSVILENRPELLINMNEIAKISKTIEFYANQSELNLDFFRECFNYNKTVREYIDIFMQLKEIGLELKKIKDSDTLESFLQKQGYDIESIGIEDFNIGIVRKNLRKGGMSSSGVRRGGIKTGEEEREILLELGIFEEEHIKKLNNELEKRNSKSVEEYIDIFIQLKEKGLDLREIRQSDTLKVFLEKQGYDIENIGIEDFYIGEIRHRLRNGGIQTGEEERIILLELGIFEEEHIKKLNNELEKRNSKSAEEYIDIFIQLEEKGLELREIKQSDTLKSFLEKQGYDIQNIGIEDFYIGKVRARLRNGGIQTRTEDRIILLELGVIEEKHIKKLNNELEKRKLNSVQEYIDIFIQLKEKGLDLKEINQEDTLKSFLEKQGYDVESIGIEDFNIGTVRRGLRSGGIKTREEERRILVELELLEEEHVKKLDNEIEKRKPKGVIEYISIFVQLKERGVDLKKIKSLDTLKSFLVKQEYDIESIGIEEFKIGQVRDRLRNGGIQTGEEERGILLDLGILEEEHIQKLKRKDEEKAIKTMKKSVAKSTKDNIETRREIQEQVMSMYVSNAQQRGQYSSIGR